MAVNECEGSYAIRAGGKIQVCELDANNECDIKMMWDVSACSPPPPGCGRLEKEVCKMAPDTCVWRGREDGCDDRGEGCAFFDYDDKKGCRNTRGCEWKKSKKKCREAKEVVCADVDDRKECKAAELCDWTAYVDGVKKKKKACVDECVGRTRKSGKRCRKDKACEWKIETKECVRKAK